MTTNTRRGFSAAVALALIALTAPEAFAEAAESVITIVTTFSGEMKYFRLAGSGAALIDWGDGTPPETITLKELPPVPLDMEDPAWETRHRYAARGSKTITLRGNITGLIVDGKNVTAIDTGRAPALLYLDCSSNMLTALDVSKNTALKTLTCDNNRISVLDLRNNPALLDLFCVFNNLTALDLSGNPALEDLGCGNNKLSALDIGKNPALEDLTCGNNRISALDISGNPGLKVLVCEGNALSKDTVIALLRALPDRRGKELGYFFCKDNTFPSDSLSADAALASDKNWRIIF